MGQKNPTKGEIIERTHCVRIRVEVDGGPRDWKNEEVRRWADRLCGQGGWGTSVSTSWSSSRTAHLHLPSLYVAQQLILACPHLRLVQSPYRGPWR